MNAARPARHLVVHDAGLLLAREHGHQLALGGLRLVSETQLFRPHADSIFIRVDLELVQLLGERAVLVFGGVDPALGVGDGNQQRAVGLLASQEFMHDIGDVGESLERG